MSQSSAPEEVADENAVVARDTAEDVESQSRPKGVYRQTWGTTWFAQIQHNKRRIYLGSFDTEEEASAAYQRAAKALRGSE